MNPVTLAAVEAVGSGLLGGGLVSGLVAAYRAKKLANPERDSYISTASHNTVIDMQILLGEQRKELAKRDARITELEAARKHDTAQIEHLSRAFADLQEQHTRMSELLVISQGQLASVRSELESLKASRAAT